MKNTKQSFKVSHINSNLASKEAKIAKPPWWGGVLKFVGF
jgi:hypothetical protein